MYILAKRGPSESSKRKAVVVSFCRIGCNRTNLHLDQPTLLSINHSSKGHPAVVPWNPPQRHRGSVSVREGVDFGNNFEQANPISSRIASCLTTYGYSCLNPKTLRKPNIMTMNGKMKLVALVSLVRVSFLIANVLSKPFWKIGKLSATRKILVLRS